MVHVTQACRPLLFDKCNNYTKRSIDKTMHFSTNRNSSIKNANHESQNSKVYCNFCLHDHRNSSTGSNRHSQLRTSVKMLKVTLEHIDWTDGYFLVIIIEFFPNYIKYKIWVLKAYEEMIEKFQQKCYPNVWVSSQILC